MFLLFLILGLILLWPGLSRAQTPGNLQQQDTLTVSVSNISIDNEFSIRGLSADFPYPVVTTISVVDQQGNPVFGLADTSRWVGPDDNALVGLKISDIWQQVLEYHLDNPAFPENQDVYQQLPAPMFTEIVESSLLPTSTMLVMDFSSSMAEEIADAKAGARLFVKLLREFDAAGIVQFDANILKFQPITRDTTLLTKAIDEGVLGSGTALYNGIMAGIAATKSATGRRGIVVYTDGQDNSSTVTLAAVIDSANVYNLPIFTIALGNETREDNLKQIADATGGLFFKVATAEEMIEIYRRLAQLTKNFYAMAHSSPDPQKNNTFRVVDITVNAANILGRGAGQYFVPGPAPAVLSDVRVSIKSQTDTTITAGGRILNAVAAGEAFSYQIVVKNLGPALADTVKLLQFLPDSVKFTGANILSGFESNELLTWKFANLAAGDSVSLEVAVKLKPDIPPDLLQLISQVHVTSDNDTSLANNFAADTVLVFIKPPAPQNYDLSLSQVVKTDTSIVLGDTPFPAARRGDIYSYEISAENHGPGLATDFILVNTAPDSVLLLNFDATPDSNSGKNNFWQIDSLQPGATFKVIFDAKVSDSLKVFPLALVNSSHIVAARDTNATNDSTTSIVFAIPRPGDIPEPEEDTDIAISQRVLTGSFSVIGADTTWFAAAGETYTYFITITNDSAVSAQNVTVLDFLPAYVSASDFSPEPLWASPDSIAWHIPVLSAFAKTQITFKATVAMAIPVGRNLLINRATVSAQNEPEALRFNNTAATSVTNITRPGQPLPPLIEASPAEVIVGDSVQVRVQAQVPNQSWDLWVIYANGEVDSSYADDFIATNPLSPGQWLEVRPRFRNTRLVTRAEQEPLLFEVRTIDIFNEFQKTRAEVTVRSDNNFIIDRNVFIPPQHNFLGIRFQLSSNRRARLDLFDVAGSHVSNLTDQEYNAGWNTLNWNGQTDKGQNVGSGVYVLTLRSGSFTAMRKVMVVR